MINFGDSNESCRYEPEPGSSEQRFSGRRRLLYVGFSEFYDTSDIDDVAGIDYELLEKRADLGTTRSMDQNVKVRW